MFKSSEGMKKELHLLDEDLRVHIYYPGNTVKNILLMSCNSDSTDCDGYVITNYPASSNLLHNSLEYLCNLMLQRYQYIA